LRAPGFVRNLLTTLIGALASRVTSVL
jgi:hypothetical protein